MGCMGAGVLLVVVVCVRGFSVCVWRGCGVGVEGGYVGGSLQFYWVYV